MGIGSDGVLYVRIDEKRMETLPLKVGIVGEDVGDGLIAHGLHRYAIRQAVTLVWTRPIKLEACGKGGWGLRQDPDRRAVAHSLDVHRGFTPEICTPSGKVIQVLRQDFLGGADGGWLKASRRLVCEILNIRERDPIKSVSEDRVHWPRLGWPYR